MSSNLNHALVIIADCYTPILLILILVEVIREWISSQKFFMLARLIFAAVIVYFWMFLDTHYQLWAMLELDYSTHTAASFALVILLGAGRGLGYKLALAISLISYGWLMYLLGYHSWMDMGSTLFVIGACIIPLIFTRFSAPKADLKDVESVINGR